MHVSQVGGHRRPSWNWRPYAAA